MGRFLGTTANDVITDVEVSPGVERLGRTPPNANPSAENDTVSGQGGDDLIAGVGGSDDLNGNAGDDTIDGGSGADVVNGGNGNDVLNGGAGNDALNGGDGDDVYEFGPDWGTDVVIASADAGKGVIEFLGGIDPEAVEFRVSNSDLFIVEGPNSILVDDQFAAGTGADAAVGAVRFANGSAISISRPLDDWLFRSGTNGGDRLNGSIFDDTLDGRAGDDSISGRGGEDELVGGRGNDEIDGGFGRDTITGSAGRDTIAGGPGRDWLDGGEDQDRFVFENGDGVALITGFEAGDELEFKGFGPKFDTAQELFDSAFEQGDGLVVRLEDDGKLLARVTILDFDFDRLDVDNFLA